MNTYSYPFVGNGYYNEGAAGLLAGMGTGMIVLSLALLVFMIICEWRVFEKAGEPGWKCLIPIYNAYIYMKICWEGKYFFYMILGMVAAVLLSSVGAASNSSALAGIGGFLMIVAYIAIFVIDVIAMIKLAKRFGKGGGFAVGLILLNTIFLAILAFDSSDYDRARSDPGYQSVSADPYHNDSGDSGNDGW